MSEIFIPSRKNLSEWKHTHYSRYQSSWKKEPKLVSSSYTRLRSTQPCKIELNGKVFSLPEKLNPICRVVEDSKYILSLEPGWNDDDGLAISCDIYYAATEFLLNYSHFIYDSFAVVIEAPEISPLPNDSIDLSWKTKSARMLINIRYNNDEIFAFYYGDQFENRNAIKGNVSMKPIQKHLASWMINLIY